ncbi:hypothetical protein F5J12DRAFT_146876 [Pisolithus orientalis]|uniref:uncharacterized protein n=1 Tax=Pisolithus orientalis TaxID=936130 RepID=UPI0022251C09|nr:uncharacterized protein F5J12DRAFT_146876 [Pisolithus orientalis]KAI6004485.1 hypothetical protein F5J12DRAFT_146876 [Pisolithus orientalis]
MQCVSFSIHSQCNAMNLLLISITQLLVVGIAQSGSCMPWCVPPIFRTSLHRSIPNSSPLNIPGYFLQPIQPTQPGHTLTLPDCTHPHPFALIFIEPTLMFPAMPPTDPAKQALKRRRKLKAITEPKSE